MSIFMDKDLSLEYFFQIKLVDKIQFQDSRVFIYKFIKKSKTLLGNNTDRIRNKVVNNNKTRINTGKVSKQRDVVRIIDLDLKYPT